MMQRARLEIGRRYGSHGIYSRKLDRLNRLPLLRAYVARYPGVPCFDTREAMWDHLAGLRSEAIDYLEFGVHTGHSILHWAGANRAPDSRFFGFDSFEGLPEEWNRTYPKGHFDTKGQVPSTSDPRLQFVKGLFQSRLDGFLASYEPGGRKLVVHIDCDLYASALYCLTKLDRFLTPGTILVFDEFGDVQHEFRAFSDYLSSYRRQAKLICAHDSYFTAAVEMV